VPNTLRRAMIFRPTLTAFAVLFLCISLWLSPSPACFAQSADNPNGKTFLSAGWMLQSSCKVSAGGPQISKAGFSTNGWHAVTVPSTVLAALIADKTYPDPYFGMNLRKIPGTSYPIGKNFSEMPMPKDSPFHCSWWYRTEFQYPAAAAGSHVWLNFEGINNHANIWLNGRQIGFKASISGSYRTYEFDVTKLLVRNGANTLALEVFPQTDRDLGMNWNDWNPTPPDKDMGLWRGIFVKWTGPLELRNPQVVTHFAGDPTTEAALTVEAEIRNASPERAEGNIEADLEGTGLTQTVKLAPGETRTIRFTPDKFPQLRIRNPELWWPWQMGSPALHSLTMKAAVRNQISDSLSARYGIREITSELDTQGRRVFRVNGKRILIRGGGWAPDMLLRDDPARLRAELGYVRDLNLNAIRLEGPMVSDDFYDLADEQGVLVLAGWTCCDFWMDWKKWTPADIAVAKASLDSQILLMRSHPSILVWMSGSDEAPPAAIARAYVDELKALDWPNPYLASASDMKVPFGEPSGMKMLGPYDYTPPDYWYDDSQRYGGAFGFSSEISPGPAIPVLASLEKMLPASDLIPGSTGWNYHAGGERFTQLTHFDESMRSVYGPPKGIDDYERKAQAMAYDAERAMFESYSRNKYSSSGVIQWMLNNAWPSLIWHLYDYYLQPAGSYFGAKKACEPIHVQYSYDDRSVVVVNSTYAPTGPLTVTAQVYDAGLHRSYLHSIGVEIEADGAARVLTLPEQAFLSVSPVNFVELTLADSSGKTIDTNFYWLSSKQNKYDWPKTDAYTAISSYEDLTALQSLPSTGKLEASAEIEKGNERPSVLVKLTNPSENLAFQIHLAVRDKNHDEILPVLWQDNYIELMPGESRALTAQLPSTTGIGDDAEVAIDGWNIDPATISLSQASAPPSSDPAGSH
jgi:exo-1,4-beta-D-glucosaminidase